MHHGRYNVVVIDFLFIKRVNFNKDLRTQLLYLLIYAFGPFKLRQSTFSDHFLLYNINIIYIIYIYFIGRRPIINLLSIYLYTTLFNSLDLLYK